MAHAQHPRKFLPDGSPNPAWKPRPSGPSGKHPRKFLPDGSPNPAWKPRSSGRGRPLYQRNFYIAWDGEGIDTAQGHQYKLLSCCWRLGGKWHSRDLVAEDGQALSSEQIFRFMEQIQRELPKRGLHVIFSSAYDVTHWLRDLPWLEAKYALLDTQKRRGWLGPYSLKVVMRKTLSVWFPRRMEKRKTPRWRDYLTLWDVWGFFQSSFVQAIERWLGADYPDLPLIRAGKAARGQEQTMAGLLAYCHAELRALVLLMEQVGGAFLQAGLALRRWDGPGAAAAAAFAAKMEKGWFEQARAPFIENPQLYEASQAAYFGGRVEMLRYGVWRGRVYHYDLNSAYPAAIAQLPDLSRGVWKGGRGAPASPPPSLTLCHVRWDFSDKMLCPFPLRGKGGRVFFPPRGEGWYWWPEVDVALALLARDREKRPTRWNYGGASLEILEHQTFYPQSNERPFAWVEHLYAQRRAAHQAGERGLALVLKLTLNSLYGKMAQQVGYVPRYEAVPHYETGQLELWDNGLARVPPFYNLAAAGWVTSWCRAQLLAAAATNPRAVVMLATDGIVSTQRLRLVVDHDKRLGGWSCQDYGRAKLVVVQSGVYYVQDSEGVWYERSRGVGFAAPPTARGGERAALVAERVATFEVAWRAGEKTVTFPARRLVTLRAAAAGEQPSPLWEKRGQFADVEGGRVIHLQAPHNSPKRVGIAHQPSPAEGLVLTAPWEDFSAEFPLSAPYEALPLEASDAWLGGELEADMQDWLEHAD